MKHFRTTNETLIYGTFCTPCLFGENQAKLKSIQGERNPSCFPGCFTYVFMTLYGSLLGLSVASCYNASPAVGSIFGDMFSHFSIGAYAGSNRTKIREFVNLPKDDCCNDCIMHTFCSPCAICQEAIAISEYELFNLDTQHIYTNIEQDPTAPPMSIVIK